MPSTGSVRPTDTDVRVALRKSQTGGRGFYELFNQLPSFVDGDGDGTAGTTGVNILQTGKYNFQMTPIGTQTIAFPTWVEATGLDWGQMDQTNGDGVEWNDGIGARSQSAFVIGTDKPFATSGTFTAVDASGIATFAIGFRKAEALTADYNDYNDLAALTAPHGTTTNKLQIETIKTNAATSVTDTTQVWSDGETHTFTVIVDSDGSLGQMTSGAIGNGVVGSVFYEIDGAKPTALPASVYKFTSGLTVVPFCLFTQHTDITTFVQSLWECGFVPTSQYQQYSSQS